MTHFRYLPAGTCSRCIEFDLEAGAVRGVRFTGGCNGNLKGIARLVEDQPASRVAALLRGNTCGRKPTSCPDQLARALTWALAQDGGRQDADRSAAEGEKTAGG